MPGSDNVFHYVELRMALAKAATKVGYRMTWTFRLSHASDFDGGVVVNRIWLLAFVLVSSAAIAQETAPKAAPAPQAQAQMPQMAQMQGKMKEMQTLMNRLHATEDPTERERLMNEHMQRMQEAMTMMNHMAMGLGGGGPGMRECAAGDTACGMERMQTQQGMMGQRMDMMQMMMQQMMGRMAEQPAEGTPGQEAQKSEGQGQNHAEHH